MDTMENTAPYAAPENIERILERVHKSGLKGKVDTDFLMQLGINDTMIPRTLRTLEFLGLIEKDGSSTSTLDQFIVSDEDGAKAILREAIQTSYAMIFRAAHPETEDRPKVFNAFKVMKPQGQWDRMTTLFLGLCRYAGMAVKEPPPNRAAKGEKRERVRRVTSPKAATPKLQIQPPTTPALPPPKHPSSAGTSKTVELRSGSGVLTLTVSVDIMELPREEREFIFDLIDRLKAYERNEPTAKAKPAIFPVAEGA